MAAPCPGVEVRGAKSLPGRGRALHATQAFEAGQQIAVFTAPLVAIPAGSATKSACSQCLAHSLPVRVCAGCKAVAYCGAACQKTHWAAIHRHECKAYKRVRSQVDQDWLPTPVRAAVQILARLDDDRVREAVDVLDGNVDAFKAHQIWSDVELQALAACTYAGGGTAEDKLALAAEILCKVCLHLQPDCIACRPLL